MNLRIPRKQEKDEGGADGNMGKQEKQRNGVSELGAHIHLLLISPSLGLPHVYKLSSFIPDRDQSKLFAT
jgi:hypothetical protein